LPQSFDEVPNLQVWPVFRHQVKQYFIQEIDLAMNELTAMPSSLLPLSQLRKLDLSFNKINKMDFPDGAFPNIETLNLSGNELTCLPQNIISCSKLQRLYASYNQLTFQGFYFN
jgi:Leucine-rich repeat (LRR) protein